jgi:hypothetical protein
MSLSPPLTFANALTELSLMTSQEGNFTFTNDELTQALTQAWLDTYVVKQVEDTSISYTPGTYSYPIPTAMTVVKKVRYQRTTDSYPEEITPDLYDIHDGNIEFNDNMRYWIYDNYTLIVNGSYKLTTADSLTTQNLVNYTLSLATEILLSRLLLKKTFVFLTNDTSLQEIALALRTIQQQVLKYKQALTREWETV